MDKDSMDALKPVYGLIFLFKWQKEATGDTSRKPGENPGVFFAKQV